MNTKALPTWRFTNADLVHWGLGAHVEDVHALDPQQLVPLHPLCYVGRLILHRQAQRDITLRMMVMSGHEADYLAERRMVAGCQAAGTPTRFV